jgi:cation transport ATPase
LHLADAIEIAQRSRFIALQSAYAGIGLSIVAMAVAAMGYLPPIQGALLQEAIDVAVVLNALRALGDGPKLDRQPLPSADRGPDALKRLRQ